MSEDTLLTASEVGRFLGISHSTFGRWSRSGKAPRPAATAAGATLYRHADVVAWLDKLALLDGEKAA